MANIYSKFNVNLKSAVLGKGKKVCENCEKCRKIIYEV
jgi:hypothetical protein